MTTELLGREHPAEVLEAEVGRVLTSHGGLVLVTGEAGIGKTSLVTVAARRARREDALVLSGSCWDSAHAPGYWPWVQVGRALRRSLSSEERAAAEAESAGGLALLLGEVGGAVPGARDAGPVGAADAMSDAGAGAGAGAGPGAGAGAGPGAGPGAGAAPTPGDPASTQPGPDTFALFDAVTSALVHAAQRRPVVVVLEDLHWADAASLRLLEFAVHHTWFERVLLIGTYRDAEVEIAAEGAAAHPLRTLLLPLQSKATTVTLTGLDRAEVAELMTRTAGRAPDPELAARVHHRTGGNPFFVEQAARLWAGGGTPLDVTPGVREVLERRLGLLPTAVHELLRVASVLGGEFSRPLLAAVAGTPAARVDALLAAAVTGRLVTARGDGRFAFAHDLVRETLQQAVPEERVRELHAAVVEAADRPGARRGERLLDPSGLARHAYLAGGQLPATRVIDLLERAGEDAHGRMALEEALRHQQRAHEVAGSADSAEVPRVRFVSVSLDLADRLSFHGRTTEAAALYRETVDRCRAWDDQELLARVALTLHGNHVMAPVLRSLLEEVLREAHAALVLGGREQPAERRLRIDDLVDQLSLRSATLARRAEDDEALTFVLWARHDAIWGLGSAAERESLTDELLALLERTGDRMMFYIVISFKWLALLEGNDPRYLEVHQKFLRGVVTEQVDALCHPRLIDQAIVNAFQGDFPLAEEAIGRALQELGEDGPFTYLASQQQWTMELARGRCPDLGWLAGQLDAASHPHPELLLGVTAAEFGQTAEALRQYRVATGRSEEYPRAVSPIWYRLRAQIAVVSGDVALAGRMREELTPHAGAWLVSWYGSSIDGPVTYWLGLLDLVLGRWDEAVRELSAACDAADAMGARPWGVRARAELAEVLRARGGAEHLARAEELWSRATADAESLDIVPLVDNVRRANAARPVTVPGGAVPDGAAPDGGMSGGGTPSGATPAPAPVDAPEPPVAAGPTEREAVREFRWDGAVWQLTFAGRTVHLPDAKGLHDLHRLLAQPGTEIPAVRLLAPEGGEAVAAARGLGGDDVLDEEAKAQYKRRLDTLDEEIDRAVERGDDRRATEYDQEREALLRELRAAAGLAGRSRRLGDEAERARKTVTARIRDVLRKLDTRHPELAAHLRDAVSTGAHCGYAPAEAVRWRL